MPALALFTGAIGAILALIYFQEILSLSEAGSDAMPELRVMFLEVFAVLFLIDGLLDIAEIEAGKMRLDHGEVHLREFLDQIVKMFRLQADSKGLDFRFECPDSLPDVVHADERRLRQILINLLANAVKFTDVGHVTLRVSYRREIARFVIEDTGIGPDDLERIFMPFERSGSASARSDVGTGLGLAITQAAHRSHGRRGHGRERSGARQPLRDPHVPFARGLTQDHAA